MKRTAEESEPERKSMPVVQAFQGDRIKVAVAAACLHTKVGEEDDLSNLSNQPIILRCIAEEEAYNYELAYWPSTESTGEKLLAHLIQLEKDDSEKSIQLVDMLTKIARKELETGGYKKSRKHLEEAVGVTGQLEKLGLICLVEQDFYFSDDEKAFYANPNLFTVSFSQLSPHLYHQECMVYC